MTRPCGSRANLCEECTANYKRIQKHTLRPNELTDADVFPVSGVHPIFLTQVFPIGKFTEDEDVSITRSIKAWFLDMYRICDVRVFVKVDYRRNEERDNVWEAHVCILVDPPQLLVLDDKYVRDMFALEAAGFDMGWTRTRTYTSPDQESKNKNQTGCIAAGRLEFFADLLDIEARATDRREYM
ncbi:uncharacterized protein DSM5745_02689 [Aspergillus mulundensis]|uniref:Uncharacterized protein n=1 Tax=Aspergillus mulundensis TaxID=1810919 RepID=A0A3D8SI95_9EURO|nr:hypothetical protein DSM5745_02689 [Aspergillus mulundensis]RDW86047.1 hypothetical protein DSM5745_02689 [Aspergillus mulundensis]